MNRYRYLLCLLLCGAMIYNAVPMLQLFNNGIQGVFARSWLLLALMVIAGNLSALLYTQNQHKNDRGTHKRMGSKKKIRSFYG